MSQFRNVVTSDINGNMRVCNLVTLLDTEVVKYMKITFIGDAHAIEYGIGNIWIEAYELDHMTKRLRPNIEFIASEDEELYQIFLEFIKSLNGKIVDDADMDFDSTFTMEPKKCENGDIGVVFKYKYDQESIDDDKVKIIVDYQYLDEDVYNALLNLYCDLESIAINNRQKSAIIA